MAVLERKGFVQNDTGTDTAFIKNPFRKQLESPANIPTGTGLINKGLNQMQKTQKQKYDVMRDTGTWSEEKYLICDFIDVSLLTLMRGFPVLNTRKILFPASFDCLCLRLPPKSDSEKMQTLFSETEYAFGRDRRRSGWCWW